MNQYCCHDIVLKIFIFALMSILLFGASQVYASTFEFTLDVNDEFVDVSGKTTPQSQVFLTVWNEDKEILIENESKTIDNDNGSFQYQLPINSLSGAGHYTAELVHDGLTQEFEFSLKDKMDSPLQQIKNGIIPDEIICKEGLTKMYKFSLLPSSKSGNTAAICVKQSSMDKLSLRGYSVEIITITATTPDPLIDNIDEFTITDALKETIRKKVDDGTHESLFVGIIDEGGIEQYYYGHTAKNESPIDENTIFEIGSVSKVFTSLILADMVVNEEINLDDPIDKFLPENVKTPSFDGKKITLLDLSTHTSGLPMMPNYPPNPDLDKKYEYSKDGIYEYLSDFVIHREIGTQFEYSNTGGSLLGHVLSLHEGKSYEQTLKERILDKIGMDSTCVNQCSNEMQNRFAKPHSLGEQVDEVNLPDEVAGAGAVRSSGKDMLVFLSYAMDLKDSELQPSFELTQTVNHKKDEIQSIGLGWQIIDDGNRNIIFHDGATKGFASFVGFDADSNEGVVVLTNSQVIVNEIGLDLLEFSFEE